MHSVSNDPRVRKRDLITFLSRPVTRLPRLNLLLDQTLKSTESDFEHPDLETLPLILEILSNCIKSTQPGIEVAESKVKFWSLCESLVYQKGEIIVGFAALFCFKLVNVPTTGYGPLRSKSHIGLFESSYEKN